MLFGSGHLFHGVAPNPALAPVALNGGGSAVARYEKRYPGVTFVIGLSPAACGDARLAALTAFEARMRLLPVPSLISVNDAALPNPSGVNRVDGYLYLGPSQLVLAEPRPADVFADTAYMTELRRRAILMPGALNDQIDPQKVRAEDAAVFHLCPAG